MNTPWEMMAKGLRRRGTARLAAYHAGRMAKRVWQRIRFGQSETRPVFIVGCQRSGTKMLLGAIAQAPAVWAHDHRLADPVFGFGHDPAYVRTPHGSLSRLVAPPALRRLLGQCPAPVAAFHAIAEAQHARALLDAFPEARVVWIYRHYADVANSAVRKWGDHQKDLIRRLHAGAWDALGWRGERVSAEAAATVAGLYREDRTDHEGAALFWYLRNHFFFADGLDAHPRVRLVQYEALVAAPEDGFAPLFAFAGVPFRPAYVASIFASSVGKAAPPVLAPDVSALCDDLHARLDAHAARARG